MRPAPDAARTEVQDPRPRRVGFTQGEIRAFRIHGVIVAAIVVGMAFVAPKGTGQILGMLFALALLPVPALVIYLLRRRKSGR